jgi:hypothetical protein
MNVVHWMAMTRRDPGGIPIGEPIDGSIRRVGAPAVRWYDPSRGDRHGALVPDAEPDEKDSRERGGVSASVGLEVLAGCVAALIENFRTGSFAAGFLPPQGLPPVRAIESDAVHWDLSRLAVAPDRREVVRARPYAGPGAITVRPTRVHGTVAIRFRRDRSA